MMPVETKTPISPGEIAQIVGSVFSTMMDLQASQSANPPFCGGDRLTAVVQLAGDRCGAVLLECDRRQACRFAGRFLSMGSPGGDVPSSGDDLVRDVLGELANMIGGNLKCVLTRGTRLSMPSVVDGGYSMRGCGAAVRERIGFECEEGAFWVTILATGS